MPAGCGCNVDLDATNYATDRTCLSEGEFCPIYELDQHFIQLQKHLKISHNTVYHFQHWPFSWGLSFRLLQRQKYEAYWASKQSGPLLHHQITQIRLVSLEDYHSTAHHAIYHHSVLSPNPLISPQNSVQPDQLSGDKETFLRASICISFFVVPLFYCTQQQSPPLLFNFIPCSLHVHPVSLKHDVYFPVSNH